MNHIYLRQGGLSARQEAPGLSASNMPEKSRGKSVACARIAPLPDGFSKIFFLIIAILLASVGPASSACTLSLTKSCAISDAAGIFVDNDIAYVATSGVGELVRVSIGGPSLTVTSRSNTANPANDVFISGGRAYMTEGYDGVEVIDSSSGTHLGSCTVWPSNLYAMGIYASGNYAYVGTSEGYLVVLSLTNPNSPNNAKTIATNEPVGSGGGLCVYSNKIYLATDSGVEVYNLGDPSTPVYLTTLSVPGGAYDVHVFEDNAYVVGPSASPNVQVRSLSNWNSIANCYSDSDMPYAIQFYGGKAYIADTGGVKELGLGSGSITISLNANVETPQTFGFEGDLGSFILDDNSDGTYSNTKAFSNMQPGSYIIHQVVPSGWTLSDISATDASRILYSSDGGASDPWHANRNAGDSYAKATVQSGNGLTVTFSDAKLFSISGNVIYDIDGSGTRNNLERYVPDGWKLELYRSGIKIKETTTSNGAYSFSGLEPNSYEVKSILPSHWSNTLPADGRRIYTALSADLFNQDFGARGSFTISGLVFHDINGDGIKNGLDSPVSGKTVQLINSTFNSAIAECTSGTDGSYQFNNIAPGRYSIKVVATSGWKTTNSPITLTSLTGSVSNQDLGLNGALFIFGMKFQDKNANGIYDSGEVPLSSWTIFNDTNRDGVHQAGETFDVTGSSGIYNLTNLTPGNYRIAEEAKSGWAHTTPAAGYYDVLLTNAGVTGKDFGNIPSLTVAKTTDPTGSTESFTFRDTVSSGDSFVLKDAEKKTFLAAPGVYRVTEDPLSGWKLSNIVVAGTASAKYGRGTSFANSSFNDGDTGVEVTIDADEYCLLTFNNSQLFEVLGLVWDDLDYDGIQDAGEPALPGISVELLDGNGNSFSPARKNLTNSEGKYGFAAPSGSYRVKFTLPSGKLFSPRDQGADDSLDSDADPASGLTAVFSLSTSAGTSDQDAGMYENKIVINEIYPNPVGSDNTAADASTWERVELKNIGSHDCSLGSWTIRDDDSPYILATIPSGTTIPAGGYLVLHIGGSSQGISNSNGDPVNLNNAAGILIDSVSCPASGSYEGLSYSCLPDATDNWDFWGEPTLGGDLSSSSLPGAANMGLDWGDAPDSFSTTESQDGPHHFVTGPYLGSKRDYETNGQPSVNANGDDISGEDDEDGATFASDIIVGLPSSFNVTASASGILQAWIDFNGDGDFGDSGEQIASGAALAAGENTISFAVPADAKAGYTYSRLRFSTASGLSFTGLASDGEVEDYRIEIKPEYLLGDRVWVDLDGDGLQDTGEPGLGGVTVNLRDGADNIVASSATAIDGSYSFANPSPGTYTIEFFPPTGYNLTVANAGNDDAIDSDVDPKTHRTRQVTVALGQSNLTIDAGIYEPASISGSKFNDKNASGFWDAGEPGLPRWRIYLDLDKDNQWDDGSAPGTIAEPSLLTDSAGGYLFSDLAPGSYRVAEVLQDGWTQSCPTGGFYDETLASGQVAVDRDFGNHVISGLSISGRKTNETGAAIKGWNITLTGTTFNGDSVSNKTITADDGSYSFTGLLAGSYTVAEESKAGWEAVGPASYSFDMIASKSDVNFVNRLVTGHSITGKKINDTGAAKKGWNITLTGTSSDGSSVSLKATTADDGSFSFMGFSSGRYTLAEELKAGWQAVYPINYTLNFGNAITIIDVTFRNRLVSGLSVSGKKTNETGAALKDWNITVMGTDFDGSAVSRRATTGVDGSYSFTGLSAGSYIVAEEMKAGWQAVGQASYAFDLTASKSDVNFVNRLVSGLSVSGKKTNETGAAVKGWNITIIGTTFGGDHFTNRTTTADDGSYSFTGLFAGSYTVTEEAKAGWETVGPASYSFDLLASKSDLDFVNRVLSGLSVTGKKTNETGAAVKDWNITITGTDFDGSSVSRRATTANDGSYSFTGLLAGSYTVAEEAKAGWETVGPASYSFDLLASKSDLDFVNRVLSGLSVTGKKTNETGAAVKDWNITIIGTDFDGSSVSRRAATANDGSYSFTGLLAGSYTVAEEAKAGWETVGSTSYSFDLTASRSDVNFVNRVLSGLSVSGKKTNETGAAVKDWNITINGTTLGGSAVSLITSTASDGSYSFTGLSAGSYAVAEESKEGWQAVGATSYSFDLTAPKSGMNFVNQRVISGLNVTLEIEPNNVLQGDAVALISTVNRVSSSGLIPTSLDIVHLLPKGMRFVSASIAPDSIIKNGNGTTTLIWTGIMPGTSPLAKIFVQATTDPDAIGALSSNVYATGKSGQIVIATGWAKSELAVSEQLLPVTLTKTSDLDQVAEGSYVTYTIGYKSNVDIDLTGVVITERVPSDLEFISASPSPDGGTDNVWTVGTLAGKESGEITVLYLVKNRANLSYESASQVAGSGYVNVRRSLSTETNTLITNSVTLSSNEFAPISTSYSVKLLDAEGTTLLEKEHGSGEYESEELESLKMHNRSIRTEGSLQASYRPTSFALPAGRNMEYDSKLSASASTKNRATSASTSQSFRYAKSLELERHLFLDKNETELAIEAKVQGRAHLGALKTDGRSSKASTVFESAGDYNGSFEINSSLEDYGSSVRMAGNATGFGQTERDLRLKKSQRSFEHGVGSYQQEEIVSTPESYIAKEVNASSNENASGTYGYGKWTSGIWSKSAANSMVGQEISEADHIREETRAGGLSDMETNASFQGAGRFRTVSEPDNESAVDLDEQYIGEYTISRKVHLGGVSRFDRPHITLVKEGRAVEKSTLVDYRITVLNDGNAALGPVYVWDPFPAGTDYVSASIKPTILKGDSANWTLLYLGIGQTVSIDLRLNITDPMDALVNRVYASGGHNSEWVFASNMSASQVGWLGCCPNALQAEMQARIDSSDSRIIWYRVYLHNSGNTSMAARVTTAIPIGLSFLNASIEPQQFGQSLDWVTEAIAPGESQIIEYRARALSEGRFASAATVESLPLDGSEGGISSIAAGIVVGNETAATHPEDGWKPPEWGLDRSDIFDSIFDSVAGDGSESSSCEGGSCPV